MEKSPEISRRVAIFATFRLGFGRDFRLTCRKTGSPLPVKPSVSRLDLLSMIAERRSGALRASSSDDTGAPLAARSENAQDTGRAPAVFRRQLRIIIGADA